MEGSDRTHRQWRAKFDYFTATGDITFCDAIVLDLPLHLEWYALWVMLSCPEVSLGGVTFEIWPDHHRVCHFIRLYKKILIVLLSFLLRQLLWCKMWVSSVFVSEYVLTFSDLKKELTKNIVSETSGKDYDGLRNAAFSCFLTTIISGNVGEGGRGWHPTLYLGTNSLIGACQFTTALWKGTFLTPLSHLSCTNESKAIQIRDPLLFTSVRWALGQLLPIIGIWSVQVNELWRYFWIDERRLFSFKMW